MRIVIDLQGAQSKGSRNRGIGRYSMSLAQAIICNRGKHEIIIALCDLFPDTIEPVRASLDGILPQENIRIWTVPGPINAVDPSNQWRRNVAELIREAFLASLKPDIVLVSSLFEGFDDDVATSIGVFSQSIPTAVILYDLIPLIYSQTYLQNPLLEKWYLKKIDHLRRADLWMAISESSRLEGIDYLGLPKNRVVNISTAADDHFQKICISQEDEKLLRQKYGLSRQFLMYAGVFEYRKNMEGLIRAFALLPEDVRRAHQLAIACSARPESRRVLENLALQQGLTKDEVVIIDYVPDDDLVALYNLCKLFVFPSWHEGFGLPALEAMRCGAPVIAANTSSLPEVIGREDALFDPFSDDAIAAKITEVLTNDSFREDLIRHSAEQAMKFSWDLCAKRAINSFERFHIERHKDCQHSQQLIRRPKMAYISPLPPEQSGIADYSAELLPELALHYDIEVIVTQPEVSDSWIGACLPIRTVEWFTRRTDRYDRILYHFGNSAFHQHMFDLLDRFPGVVVLHDFFLSSLKAHLDLNGFVPEAWVRELYYSHGYRAVMERFHAQDRTDTIFKYPCNFSVLQRAVGVIVHSDYSARLAEEWYGDGQTENWSIIPLLRVPARWPNRDEARKTLGLRKDDLIICSFGRLGPIKQNHRLLRAWLSSSLAQNHRCRLIFVGENDEGEYGQQMQDTIRKSVVGDRLKITGWTDANTFRCYLAAADIAVQLRARSRGETSAAILDCMNFGLPTIVNANGSIAELPRDSVWMLPDEFEDRDLIEALEKLGGDAGLRQELAARAKEHILTQHAPRACAEQYAQVIETLYADNQLERNGLVDVLAELDDTPDDENAIMALAAAIAQNLPIKWPANQLMVDVSALVEQDLKTGIQRVARSVLKELLKNPPAGYRVEPVYATMNSHGYLYARRFTLSFLNCPVSSLSDEPIEVNVGDIFLGLDMHPMVVPAQADYLESLRHQGTRIYFVVHDLLPIVMPDAFPSEASFAYIPWLESITRFDGAICVSRTTAEALADWLKENSPKRSRPFEIGWSHNGADIENSVPNCGLPDDAPEVLAHLATRPSFLMVGTIEPRKQHAHTLAAFEQLWAKGIDVNLVIVGKQGWKVETLSEILHHHSERGKRLFWLEGISDEYLEKVYSSSTCLIAASEGEGFGLPLIEAAQHKLPIIARDIPVFREVAGEHAFYFKGKEPSDLANTVLKWLELYESNRHPKSDDMPWLTWKESTRQILNIILNEQWYIELSRDGEAKNSSSACRLGAMRILK